MTYVNTFPETKEEEIQRVVYILWEKGSRNMVVWVLVVWVGVSIAVSISKYIKSH